MTTVISPANAQKVWVFAQNGDGTLSPATIGGGGGAVSSVFTRTGAVVAANGDYSFSQISGSVAASQLPNPSASTLGGVNSHAAVTHQFLTQIGTDGTVSGAQPATTDLSDIATFSISTSGSLSISKAGALSASAINFTGLPITGGSGTTTFPLAYFNSTGTAPTTFSANGTFLGFNAPSGFTGNYIDAHLNGGASSFIVSSNGSVTCAGITSTGTILAAAGSVIGMNGRSHWGSGADGRLNATASAGGSGSLTRISFGTEAANNPAFSFDGTTATITACDGAGTAANGIFAAALYKSGASSGVSAGSFATITAITTVGGIVTQLTGSSDGRLKDSVAYDGGLDVVKQIVPAKYRWNKKGQAHTGINGEQEFVGFIAQNVQTVIPEAITNTEKSKDGSEEYLSFDDRPVVAALVNAVKELAAKVERLEAK